MHLRNNLKLFFLLRLPKNREVKERYDFARQEARVLRRDLLDTASYNESEHGARAFGDHLRSIRTIERLLLEPARFVQLASYRRALAREDMERVKEIESELN